MATTSTFDGMLNEYLANPLLMAEYIKRDWAMSNVEIDNSWKLGTMPVPFEGACASSIEFGQLAASTDIATSSYVRGEVSSHKEVWASLILYHKDLMNHNGKIPETTFLKIVPNEADKLLTRMKETVSVALLNGSHLAKVNEEASSASGILGVDHAERFTIGQKVTLDDDNSAAADYYVIAIDMNATLSYGSITLSATRGGGAANVSAYTIAQNAKLYSPGVLTNGSFTSMREALLSAANGGSAALYGQTKTAYPYLQATNATSAFGASITASNILDKIFDFYTTVRTKGRGNANTILLSYKHLGSILKLIETQKGPFSVSKQPNASLYGWTEIEITSVKGNLKIVAVQEADDDIIMFLDMSAFKFYTNGGFKKRQAPDGKEYFEIRATTGYAYVLDFCLFGELVCAKPNACGIIPSVSY